MRPAYLFLINILYFAVVGAVYILLYDFMAGQFPLDAVANGMHPDVVKAYQDFVVYGFPFITVISMVIYDFTNAQRPSDTD